MKFILFALAITISLVACERSIDESTDITTEVVVNSDGDTISVTSSDELVIHDAADDYSWDNANNVSISLADDATTISGDGASVSNNIVTISAAGTYALSGQLSNGQIVVNSEDDAIVRLIFSSINITCNNNAPIYIQQASKTMIVLAEGTNNYVSDGANYSSSEEDANACIFSKDDLTIYGDGNLNVEANYNDGITGKDGLIIASGNISITAIDDGLRGKDYLIIKDGTFVITALGDGLKSDNDEDTEKGFITIATGDFTINSGGDGLQASTQLDITKGNFDIISGGGSSSSLSTDASAKALKSGTSTTILDGTFEINAADDAMHSDGDLNINDGTFTIASGDDALHAEADLNISSGDFYINEAYEGIESALGSINISGGNIYIYADDDGINVSAGGGSNTGRPSNRSTTVTESSSAYALNISNGYLFINCNGDGLDSNDELTITGGTMLVNSSSQNNNSALDYDGTCTISDGFLVAVGSSGMSEAPGTSSSQYSVLINFSSSISSGTLINIQDTNGNSVLTYKTVKASQSIAFSSSMLTKGESYNIYTGGSSSGTYKDGLYTEGTYTAGVLANQFTISSTVTKVY